MKRLGLALAVAALIAAPHAALAQRASGSNTSQKPADKSAAAAKVDPKQVAEQRTRGMKEAPAVVALSDIKTCQVSDALFRGQADDPAAKGKKSSVYEVACQSGPGYIVIAKPSEPKPMMLNCIIASGGNAKCELPQNKDFNAALTPAVQATGRPCSVSDVRYVGSTPATGMDFYEVACAAPKLGFLIGVNAAGRPPEVNDCLSAMGTSQECKLVTKAQIIQSYAPLVAKSGKPCQVSDIRSIGRSKASNEEFIELACSGGAAGLVLVTDAAGGYKNAVDCAKAQGIGGGCKLTDVTVSQTQEAGAYTKLAAKAGFSCNVKQYRFIGMDPQNREVVELACSDRPDGALALFSETGKSQIVDCVRAPGIGGTTCKLTDPAIVYPKYTEALAAKGRGTCKVSNAAFLARTTDGLDFVETACADGLPGYVVSFAEGGTAVKDLLNCKQAASAGVACKLPGNTAK